MENQISTDYSMYVSNSEAEINLPTSKINLTKWLLGMTNEEYASCSKNHIAMGVSTDLKGNTTLINVEKTEDKIPMVHQYKVEIAEKNRIKVKSEKSIFFMKKAFTMPITWDIKIEPNGKKTILKNEITVEGFDKLIPKFIPTFMRKSIVMKAKKGSDGHNNEETPNFAKLIEKKFK